jgi:glycosyltransferase involved in cell wall biosynthesis
MNEARNIDWVLARLPDVVDEVVLVDGRSTDDTVAVARRVRPDVRVVEQPGKGKGDALRAGFHAARGDFIVMIDADGSMDPAEIVTCIAALQDRRCGRSGHELVKGSRFVEGGGTEDMSGIRRLGNAGLLRVANRLYGARFTDLCYGLFAFRRDQLEAMDLRADGFEIETEMVVKAVKAGIDVGEVPSFEANRLHGDSNLNAWRDGWRVLRTLLRQRMDRRALAEARG